MSAAQSPRGDSASQRSVSSLAALLFGLVGEAIDEPLLLRALTHRSYAYEHGGLPNNERLEFLGDSVLGLVVADSLFVEYPELTDGQLSTLKASVVNMRALAGVARTLGLGDYILLGRGEEGDHGRDKSSILADTLEAVIATVYLSGGLTAATAFVHHLLDPLMQSSVRLGFGQDWKTSLQELAVACSLGWPEYRVTEEGPDHQKSFHAESWVGAKLLGSGDGRTKKEAEQMAAEGAWAELKRRSDAVQATTADPGRASSNERVSGARDPHQNGSPLRQSDEPADCQDA